MQPVKDRFALGGASRNERLKQMSKKKEDPTKYEKKTGVIPEFYTKVRLGKLIHRTPSGVDNTLVPLSL